MVDDGFVEAELVIDWDHLFENIPDDLNFDFGGLPAADGVSTSPDSGLSFSIDDIEQYLMSDDCNHAEEKDQEIIVDGFLSEVLLDLSPGPGSDRSKDSSPSPELVEVETDQEGKDEDKPRQESLEVDTDQEGKNDVKPRQESVEVETDQEGKDEDKLHQNGVESPQTEENNDVVDDDDDDPVAKKRKRQMRNRDAAVRSRERKKMYVRDLEMKSKYYEAECKRLGTLLQCCLAENQALRLSLHNTKAFDASMSKQESAVLLLESLLLGSLLGYLGIICLLILPSWLLSTLERGLLANTGNTVWGSVAPRNAMDAIDIICNWYDIPQMDSISRSRLGLMEFSSSFKGTTVRVEFGDATIAADPSGAHTISRSFPHTYGQPIAHFLRATAKVPDAQIITEHPAVRVGVVFCGRQSPGGHNVVWGLLEALKIHNLESVLLGFLGGSEGLFAQKTLEVTDEILATYKNQGGYDLLGRTKDQIRTTEQVNAALNACTALKLDALVIIGGVTSNTDAAQLAETFAERKCPTKVVGIPVTLNGDLKNQFVETNVGFDTICKVNSQLISNVCTDALSAEKYYYFIRLMGRKASHVALECTLQSHPNMVILAEEVAASKLTLFDITKQICDAVQARAEQDKYHGVILLPEGLIESIPEVFSLLQEIHGLLRQGVSADNISAQLSPWASALFEFLPPFIRKQLLLHPESDDSAQLSQIETEKLLAHLVEAEMNKRLKEGTYKGKKFNAICHFFGYQARGSLPSKFDCDYAYVLGHIAYHILAAGLNGYMATVTNLKNPVNKWKCGAAPITAMMTVKRYGRGHGASTLGKPALHPATVDLKGKSYELLRQNAIKFLMDDVYRNPGPLQFDGPGADAKAVSLCVEDQDYMGRIKKLQEHLDKVRSIVKPGCSQDVLKAALSAMASVTDILSVMSSPSTGGTPF
ncbi:UNVERIFIED_CONTAM: Pyrophosphate--fructose 6-phosphate 1-phosphotransferase subunit alpha [Sesamum radiatum]|uniref:Pyrophosphate--fructose 6-phosphate 1-phosphotransferase subunit alpha n=2 Tax=Magnoliopsida TaxID=3398 RepID=A0AAW2SIG7_SESRA